MKINLVITTFLSKAMFKKIVSKQLDLEPIKNALLLSIVFCALFQLPIMHYKFNHSSAEHLVLLKKLGFELGLAYCCIVLFFLGLMLHPTLYKFGTFAIFLCSAIASYSFIFLKQPPSYKQTSDFLEVGAWQMATYLNPSLYIWLGFTMVVCYFASSQYRLKGQPQLFLMKLLSASCLFLVLYKVFSPAQSFLLKSFFPLLYLNHLYKYFLG